MKTLLVAVAALGLTALSHPAAAQADRSPTEAANARIVVDFYDMAFNRHQPTQAARL